MNDRVSNAPPPTFLGPDERAAYERQFYADSSHTRSRPTSGSEQSFNRTSGSKFWEGIRDKFTRTKSSSSITTVSSSKSRASNRFSQQSQQSQIAPTSANDEKENVPGYYPSREEVMENYKSLVDAGFFSSHAIQSTRHQPPPTWAGVKTDHALPAPPRPPPPAPFSQLVAQKQRQLQQQQSQIQNSPATPALSSIFASIPYSATQPSPTGDAPLTTYARPDPRPPISLPKKYRRPHATTTYQMAAPPTTPASPHRGTKRAVADMTGGSVDREMANAGSNSTDNVAEAGARKLVKKLRKSASRISADLSLRPATSAGNGNPNNHPYGAAVVAAGGSTKDIPVLSAASSTSVNLVPRPPISSAGRAMGVVRSLSNSFKRDGGRTTPPAAPGPDISAPAAGSGIFQPTTALPPNKLLKARRSISRRVSLGRSRPGSISSSSAPPPVPTHLPPPVPSHLPPPVPPHRSQPPQRPPPAPPIIIPSPEPAPPRPSTTSIPANDGGDPMVLDELDPNPSPSPSSPSKTRNHSLDVQPGGLTVPSFHYPQRQKKVVAPLAASPNRGGGGGPVVGQQQQQHHHVKNGSFCFGTPAGVLRDSGLVGGERGGGVRDVDKENYAVY